MIEVNFVVFIGMMMLNLGSFVINFIGIGEEFNQFFQLLMVQVQNQDFLLLLDLIQFVEQLVIFLFLEQQVRINLSFDSIVLMIGDLYVIIVNDWFGLEVVVVFKYVVYEGELVEFEVNFFLMYDKVVLIVFDSQGKVVWQEVLDVLVECYMWDGLVVNQSVKVVSGIYQFQFDLFKDGQFVVKIDVEFISKVMMFGNENGKLVLGIENYLMGDFVIICKIFVDQRFCFVILMIRIFLILLLMEFFRFIRIIEWIVL